MASMAAEAEHFGPGIESVDGAKRVVVGYIGRLRAAEDVDDLQNMDTIAEQISTLCVSFASERPESSGSAETKSPPRPTVQAPQPPPPSASSWPPLSNPYHLTISRGLAMLMDAIEGDDGWEFQGEKQGVVKFRKDPPDGALSIFRGEKVLDLPQNVLLNAVQSRSVRFALGNGIMADCGVLERVGPRCTVQFEQFKAPIRFVAARDFVYIRSIHRLDDGTILSFGSSVEHRGRPRSDDFCRADLKIGGWAFRPMPEDPGRTRVFYVAQLDLAGYVPGWLMNRIAAEVPLTIERLNNFLLELGDDLKSFDRPINWGQPNAAKDTPSSPSAEEKEAIGSSADDSDDRASTERDEESEGTMDVSWTGEHIPDDPLDDRWLVCD